MKSSVNPRAGRPLPHVRSILTSLLFVLAFHWALAQSAAAQGFTRDARIAAMGGGDRATLASSLTEDTKSYRSIVVPLGLFQLYQHRHAFDPTDRVNFNPLRVIEDLSNPFHFTTGREDAKEADQLVTDLVNGKLNRNLLTYKGFIPKSPLTMEGLFAPSFGKTIRLPKIGSMAQGIFLGVGPYMTVGTTVTYDQALLNAWSGASSSIPANSSLTINDYSRGQAGLQGTAGYRVRFENPKALKVKNGTDRDGVYLAVNYNYIYGFRYDADTIDARFDTDAAGLIVLAIPAASPLLVDRNWSKSGRGRAVDVGSTVVTGPWEFSFGAKGIGNRVRWDDMVHEQFALSVLIGGLNFAKTTLPALNSSITFKLPVQYTGGAAYYAKKWAARGQLSKSLNGREYHGGAEYHLGPIDLRGGGRYAVDKFTPTGGVGLNLGSHFGIDVAAFRNTANSEQDRRFSTAMSLRFQ